MPKPLARIASLDGLGDQTIKLSDLYRRVDPEGGGTPFYVADLEPIDGWGNENIAGLQTKLNDRTERHRKASDKLKDFDGIDPAVARDAQREVDDLKRQLAEAQKGGKGGGSGGGHEEAVAAALKTQESQHQSALSEKDKAIEKLTKQLDTQLLEKSADAALAAAELDKEARKALRPHILSASRVVTNDAGERVARLVQMQEGEETPIYSAVNAGTFMAHEEFVSGPLKQEFPSLYPGTGRAGSGSKSGDGAGGTDDPALKGRPNPFDPKTRNLTEQIQLKRTDPAAFERLKAAAGA